MNRAEGHGRWALDGTIGPDRPGGADDRDAGALARSVLGAYDLRVRSCSLAAASYNTVFRVEADDGRRYALRVGPELRIHAPGGEGTEAAWLAALREAGVAVSRVVPAADGRPAVEVRPDPSVGARTCMLFEWVPGGPLRAASPAAAFRRAGRLAARVHEHGAAWDPPVDAPLLTADRVLYWRAESRLAELEPAFGALFAEALDRAQAVVDRLWAEAPHRPHVLHGDLTPANFMVRKGTVALIDFQDLVLGFEVQDLAIAATALERLGDPALASAFRAGYEELRRWPSIDGELLDGLVAARRLHQVNLGLNLRKPGVDAFVARHAAWLAAWMRGRAADRDA